MPPNTVIVPTTHGQRHCPRCQQTPLEETHYDGYEIDICPHCAGLWCEPEAWSRERLGTHPDFGAYQNQPADVRAPGVYTARQSNLVCPECARALTTVKAGIPPVCDIEQCDHCGGIWFDHQEWDHIAALQQWPAEQARLEAEPTWANWWMQLLLQLPTEFNIRPRRVPYVTISLIVISCIVFLLQLVTDETLWIDLAAVPDEIDSGIQLWTLLTSLFLHGSWVHLLGNMYFLYILGDNVEDVLGAGRYLAFYLICGVVASLLFVVLNIGSDIPILGASGAIAGIMAAYLLLFRSARLTFMFFFRQYKIPVWVWLGIWFVFNLFMALLVFSEGESMGGIAWSAHVGGFVMGLALIWPFEEKLVRSHSLLQVMRMQWQT